MIRDNYEYFRKYKSGGQMICRWKDRGWAGAVRAAFLQGTPGSRHPPFPAAVPVFINQEARSAARAQTLFFHGHQDGDEDDAGEEEAVKGQVR